MLNLKFFQVLELNRDPEYVAWKERLAAYLLEQENTQLENPDNAKENLNIRPSLIPDGYVRSWNQNEQDPAAIGIFPSKSTFTVQNQKMEPSGGGLMHHPGVVDKREGSVSYQGSVTRPSLLIPRTTMIPFLDLGITESDVKAMSFRDRLSIFTEGASMGMGPGLICTPSVALLKLDAAYSEQEDRMELERTVEFIEQHKAIDPLSVLFDFSRRQSDREYDLDLTNASVRIADHAASRERRRRTIDPMKGSM